MAVDAGEASVEVGVEAVGVIAGVTGIVQVVET